MPINTTTETLITLRQATRVLPSLDGKRVHISTIWRWIRIGSAGVHLEHCRLGVRLMTSREALGRFMAARTQADARPRKATRKRPRSAKQRDRAVATARVELKKRGL